MDNLDIKSFLTICSTISEFSSVIGEIIFTKDPLFFEALIKLSKTPSLSALLMALLLAKSNRASFSTDLERSI